MNAHDPLRRYPLFAVLDPAAVATWLASGEVRPVELGETLFQAGTPGQHAFLVQDGRVRVLRPSKGGRDVALGTFGPGELFGEYALLPPGRNTATCRAASAGRVLQLPLGPLRQALAAQPEIHAHLKRWLRLHAILGHLRDRSSLGFLSATSLVPLLDRFEPARFTAGQAIQADGLSADCWFVILKGQVRVGGTPGEPPTPSELRRAGDCFGEGALVGREGLPLAEAQAETECVFLRREAFYRPLEGPDEPGLQTEVSHLVAPRPCFPWVGQEEATDCGVAALAMIARFHGQSVSPASLRRLIRVGPRGASLLELQRGAAALGFRCRAVRVGVEQLASVRLPALAHLADEHYVVVYALDQGGLVVGDPATAVVTLPTEAFRRAWTGTLLLLGKCERRAAAIPSSPGGR